MFRTVAPHGHSSTDCDDGTALHGAVPVDVFVLCVFRRHMTLGRLSPVPITVDRHRTGTSASPPNGHEAVAEYRQEPS